MYVKAVAGQTWDIFWRQCVNVVCVEHVLLWFAGSSLRVGRRGCCIVATTGNLPESRTPVYFFISVTNDLCTCITKIVIIFLNKAVFFK